MCGSVLKMAQIRPIFAVDRADKRIKILGSLDMRLFSPVRRIAL